MRLRLKGALRLMSVENLSTGIEASATGESLNSGDPAVHSAARHSAHQYLANIAPHEHERVHDRLVLISSRYGYTVFPHQPRWRCKPVNDERIEHTAHARYFLFDGMVAH